MAQSHIVTVFQIPFPFLYTGEIYDAAVGQYYLRARFYNPLLGRFHQEDDRYDDGLNLYAYCRNNPVMYADPSGHGTTSATDKWIEAGADPETAKLAAELYPDAQDLKPYYDNRDLGHNASDAVTLARQEILYGSAAAESLSQNNYKRYEGTGVAKSGYSEWYQSINQNQSNGGNRTSYGDYSTKIDAKVSVVNKQDLPNWLVETYKDGNYRTVMTNEDITVYRSFGYNAEAGGAFATSNPALNRVQTKIDCAILPEWKNSLRYEAEIIVPKGTILNIGRVEEQFTMSGAKLAGGADQILLPQNWDLNWINRIREVSP